MIFSLKFVSPIEKFLAKVEHLIGAASAGVVPKDGNVTPIVIVIIE